MIHRRSLAAAALLVFTLGACTADPAATQGGLPGTWVEPIPGMPGEWQGFSLHADGSAESINMATFDHQRWRMEGNTLVLIGDSIGNGITVHFEQRHAVELETDRPTAARRRRRTGARLHAQSHAPGHACEGVTAQSTCLNRPAAHLRRWLRCPA